MFDDLIKQLVNSSMARKDASGFAYVPTAAGQQQERDNAYKDAAMTGYYAPPDLTNTLDQIRANKDINLNTQDETARTNAQQQNHALYNVLKNRYGIDGESQFNSGDANTDSQNMASAYKGMPTLAKDQNDWARKVQLAGLLGTIDGQDTLAKQTFDANQAYRAASLAMRGIGGGRSSSGRSSSSSPGSAADWTTFFAEQAAKGVNLGQIVDKIQSEGQNLMQQGEDPNKMIDAAYKVFSNGRFTTKKQAEDWIDENWTKKNEKLIKDGEIDSPIYGPPNVTGLRAY